MGTEEKEKLINDVCEIISKNLGSYTADLYRKFYQKQNEEEILISVEELLSELIGSENAKKQLKNINKNNENK